jgi:hypothetical protein
LVSQVILKDVLGPGSRHPAGAFSCGQSRRSRLAMAASGTPDGRAAVKFMLSQSLFWKLREPHENGIDRATFCKGTSVASQNQLIYKSTESPVEASTVEAEIRDFVRQNPWR